MRSQLRRSTFVVATAVVCAGLTAHAGLVPSAGEGPARLKDIASYADGLGAEKRLVIPVAADGTPQPASDLVKRAHAAKLLIMDEPTAALNDAEVEVLFGLIRRFVQPGTGVIYISHRIDELKRIWK